MNLKDFTNKKLKDFKPGDEVTVQKFINNLLETKTIEDILKKFPFITEKLYFDHRIGDSIYIVATSGQGFQFHYSWVEHAESVKKEKFEQFYDEQF